MLITSLPSLYSRCSARLGLARFGNDRKTDNGVLRSVTSGTTFEFRVQ